jgi:purine-binding chemotaxis protein CheW
VSGPGGAFLLVRAGGRQVGLAVEAVIEVREPSELGAIPSLEPALRGVTALRGQLMPVLNLAALLGGAAGPGTAVVVTDLGGRRVGLEVDEADIVVGAGVNLLRADETLPWARAIAVLPGQVYVPLLDLGALSARLTEVST